MALTELRFVKIALGIAKDDASEDPLLTQLIEEANAGALTFMGRNIETETYTKEYHNGTGRERLYLHHPVITVATDIRVDAVGYAGQNSDGFSIETKLVLGQDFFVEDLTEGEQNRSCLISRINGNRWRRGIGNVEATYIAGYAAVPNDIRQAMHQLIARLKEDSERGRPVMSEKLGSYSYQLLSGGVGGGIKEGSVLLSAAAVLDSYRMRTI